MSVNSEPLNPNRIYVIATLEDWFRSRDGPSIGRYYEEHPEQIPPHGQGPIYTVILRHMAQQSWNHLFTFLDADASGSIDSDEFASLDMDQNGFLNRHDIMDALERILGLQTFPGEYAFVDYVLASVGATNSTLGVPLGHLNEVQAIRKSSLYISDCELPIEKQ